MISGDISQLEQLISRLGQSSEIEQAAAIAAKPIVQNLVDAGFISATAPSGTAWSALKDGSGRIPLQGLRSFFRASVHGNQVQLINEKPYAIYHQTGTRFMDNRKMVPETELPNSWSQPISQPVLAAVKQKLQGDG
jgi:hypothetical protein